MLTTRLLKSRFDRQHSKKENSRKTEDRDAAVFPYLMRIGREKGAVKNEAAFHSSPWEQ